MIESLIQQYRETQDTDLRIRLRDQLIMENMVIAFSIAKMYRHYDRDHNNDIIGAAITELVISVTVAPEKLYDNKIKPYLSSRIRGAVYEHIRKDRVIVVPQRVDPVEIVELQDYDGGTCRNDTVPLFDLLKWLKCSQRERQILCMLIHGYSRKEVAKHLNISESLICYTLHEMRKRYRACEKSDTKPRRSSIVKRKPAGSVAT